MTVRVRDRQENRCRKHTVGKMKRNWWWLDVVKDEVLANASEMFAFNSLEDGNITYFDKIF